MDLPSFFRIPEQRTRVLQDCSELVEAEVKAKSGLSGLAIKAAYSIVKGIRPTFIPESLDNLLDDFAVHLEPIYQEAKQQNVAVAAHFEANRSRVADALLAITDARAKRSSYPVVVKAYDGLRGKAKQHVEAAVPRLGLLVEAYDRVAT